MGTEPGPSHSDEISFEEYSKTLARYPDRVPKSLEPLDAQRLNTIPELLQQRKKKHGSAYLEKKELVYLVEWKLKHGTFRPKLASLAASNSEKEIREQTMEAFKAVDDSSPGNETKTVNETFAALTKLRGIGPATASLVLSCYDPATLPFFSDELFRYVHETLDWRRKIGYTKKEYMYLSERVREICKRLGQTAGKPVSAVDLEKVAYVLGKEAKESTGETTSKSMKRAAKDIEIDTKKAPATAKRRRK